MASLSNTLSLDSSETVILDQDASLHQPGSGGITHGRLCVTSERLVFVNGSSGKAKIIIAIMIAITIPMCIALLFLGIIGFILIIFQLIGAGFVAGLVTRAMRKKVAVKNGAFSDVAWLAPLGDVESVDLSTTNGAAINVQSKSGNHATFISGSRDFLIADIRRVLANKQ